MSVENIFLRFSRLTHFFLAGTFFLLLFQFETLVYTNSQAISLGLESIWTRSYLMGSEITLLLFFLCYFLKSLFSSPSLQIKVSPLQLWSITGIVIGILLSYFFATDSWLHILKSRHIIEGLLLFYILYSDKSLHKTVLFSIAAGGAFEAVIMILQFLLNSSLGLSFLKEPVLSSQDLTTAKFYFLGETHIRAYGTFLHPNIAAAYLLLSLFLTLHFKEIFLFLKKWLFFSLLLLLFAGILVSFSKTAYFILLAIAIIRISLYSSRLSSLFSSIEHHMSTTILIKKNILRICWALLLLSLVFILLLTSIFFFFDASTITDRILLLKASFQIALSHPFGVGLGSFILSLNQPSFPIFFPWEYQPVHSLFMLFINELGIIGGISGILFIIQIFFPFFSKIYFQRILSFTELGIFLTFFCFACVDHFWLTSWTGWIALITALSLVFDSAYGKIQR